MIDTSAVTRLVVIDHTGDPERERGRIIDRQGVHVDLELQDHGQTLKVFMYGEAHELKLPDLKVETCVVGGDASVKITHIPTGKFAVANARSELQAKADALKDLKMLVFGG